MKTLYIISGIPGSGKSTLAKIIQPDPCARLEADRFFTARDGTYNYVPHLVPAAHEWCKRQVELAMQEGWINVVVSNTSTIPSRVDPYKELAAKYGYEVQHIVCFGKFQSVHNVPEEHIEKFRNQLRQSLPGWV